MLFAEPPRTAYDLNFVLAGVPIRVHPFFWIISVMMVARADMELVHLLIWTGVVLCSIVVHELGHSLAFRHYGWPSHIVLYAFGGLAVPEAGYGQRVQTPQSRMVIALAGPLAGFMLAGLVVLSLWVTGFRIEFDSPFFSFKAGRGTLLTPLTNFNLWLVIDDLLYVNIFWGLVNLLPVFPLDGGQFFREVLTLQNPRDGFRQALILSIFTAVLLAVIGYVRFHDFYLMLLFGYLAYMSYLALTSIGGYGGGRW